MNSLFNLDNPVFTFLSKLADLFILNIVFLICCLPVVTIGAATTALYSVTLLMVKEEEGSIIGGFFKSFKQNFKQATIIWLIMLVLGIIFSVDIRFWLNQTSKWGYIVGIITLSAVFIFSLVAVWIFPTLSKFENTNKDTVKNSFYFSFKHLPTTILIIAIPIIYVVLFFMIPIFTLITFVIGFAIIVYLQSIFILKVFKKYMPVIEE